MKKIYNAPMTESQEVMAQMIMQTASAAGGPTTDQTTISDDPIDWGN